jgi:flavodoxin
MVVLPVSAQKNDKILIAYFTWAENTVIIDRAKAIREANNHVFSVENRSSVDAVTTASVIPPGNTRKLAKWIQEETGGDLFSITVEDMYSCYWDEILDRASREKARRARPELTSRVSNISDYDVVFLGFPTWWYTTPMPIASFVESHDLSNKTIVPFVSHGTSGVARTIRDLKRVLPASASIESHIGVYRSETNDAQPKVDVWLEELGY